MSSRTVHTRRGHARHSDWRKGRNIAEDLARRTKRLYLTVIDTIRKHPSSYERPPPNTPSIRSLESLLKVTPRVRHETSLTDLPCLRRSKSGSKPSKTSRGLRPLRLNNNAAYVPRSPIDSGVQELLRSPNAFSEISDPIRSMSFVREREEIERRKYKAFDIWEENYSAGLAPEKPERARQAIEPLFVKTKVDSGLRDRVSAKDAICYEVLVRDDTSSQSLEIPSIWKSSFDTHSCYSTHSSLDSCMTPPVSEETARLSSSQNLSPCSKTSFDSSGPPSPTSPYISRPLSAIDEEAEHPQPRSFFDVGDSDDEVQKKSRRRKYSIRRKLSSRIGSRGGVQEDADVFKIDSSSSWGSFDTVRI